MSRTRIGRLPFLPICVLIFCVCGCASQTGFVDFRGDSEVLEMGRIKPGECVSRIIKWDLSSCGDRIESISTSCECVGISIENSNDRFHLLHVTVSNSEPSARDQKIAVKAKLKTDQGFATLEIFFTLVAKI